ncbi:THO complex subunit 4, partial [Lecanoromycetidae sp. Uapishka_2]
MDRPLEDVISERQWNNRNDSSENIDTDWVHDKFDDDSHIAPRQNYRQHRTARVDRYSPEPDTLSQGARLRVDNLHYDLSEDDLEDLFTRIAPVSSISLKFDRAGRSSGTAFVTYHSISAANRAIREFDGANAAGQPIRLTLLPTAPSVDLIRGRGGAPRNPFDTAVKPSRSLFERIEDPSGRSLVRSRSRSPGASRRSNVSKPPPEGVDRYVPSTGGRRRRSRTRSPRRRSPTGRARSPIRGRGARSRAEEREGGHKLVNGRPRKTQEELDREMEDYWGNKGNSNGAASGGQDAEAPVGAVVEDDDIDMIE